MSWIAPITDRTLSDVVRVETFAKKIRQHGFDHLTAAERQEWLSGLKGALNAKDLNRIEGNMAFLVESLGPLGYYLLFPRDDDFNPEVHTSWGNSDIPLKEDLARILANAKGLSKSLYIKTMPLPSSLNSPGYEDINKIENLLLYMRSVYDAVLENRQISPHVGSPFEICGAVFTPI